MSLTFLRSRVKFSKRLSLCTFLVCMTDKQTESCIFLFALVTHDETKRSLFGHRNEGKSLHFYIRSPFFLATFPVLCVLVCARVCARVRGPEKGPGSPEPQKLKVTRWKC